MDVEFTQHAREVMAGRRLDRDWIIRTIDHPELVETADDGTRHFLARLPERDGHILRVVVDAQVEPGVVVTAFSDRRMRGRLT